MPSDKRKKKHRKEPSESPDDSDSYEERRRRKKSEKKIRSKRRRTPSESDPDSDAGSDSEPEGADEQKLREYLAKKAQRKALKVARALKSNTVSGYTNDSNPFGDVNLTENFVWRKKIEREVLTGKLDPNEISLKAEKVRMRNRAIEIEKVKKRRSEREREKAQHEEEMAMLARERARAEFQDWEQKEEEFHFEQSKVRSEIRLREGRAKPIDILAKNLNVSDDFDVEINEPQTIFKGLTVKEMQELRDDITVYAELDRSTDVRILFWESLLTVCNHEILEAEKRDAFDRARVRGEEPPEESLKSVTDGSGLHKTVEEDVQKMLGGKSSAELESLRSQIVSKMEKGTAKVVEYWEAVLKWLSVFKAKAVLTEIHADLLRQHLSALQKSVYTDKPAAVTAYATSAPTDADEDNANVADEPGSFSPVLMTEDELANEKPPDGSFSPELLHGVDGEEAVDPEQDRLELERKRAEVLAEQQRRMVHASSKAASAGDEAVLTSAERAAAAKMMGSDDGDVTLGAGAEVSLESQVYWWHDKYRPRKPKYFNRVHTGYEWNKYNQTHYDHDNPPPKVVQGYKFNIFFPDLIDKTVAPTFTIERDGSNGETCLIRFHAGPPYEDIAFRVVNKEWEYSHKKGFKCTFDRGILHLYFNFKRHRYRR